MENPRADRTARSKALGWVATWRAAARGGLCGPRLQAGGGVVEGGTGEVGLWARPCVWILLILGLMVTERTLEAGVHLCPLEPCPTRALAEKGLQYGPSHGGRHPAPHHHTSTEGSAEEEGAGGAGGVLRGLSFCP